MDFTMLNLVLRTQYGRETVGHRPLPPPPQDSNPSDGAGGSSLYDKTLVQIYTNGLHHHVETLTNSTIEANHGSLSRFHAHPLPVE